MTRNDYSFQDPDFNPVGNGQGNGILDDLGNFGIQVDEYGYQRVCRFPNHHLIPLMVDLLWETRPPGVNLQSFIWANMWL